MTDSEICRRIAAEIEDGSMPGAIAALLTSYDSQAPDAIDQSTERPRLAIDLAGEDGNAFFLICRCIHALVKGRRELAACTILAGYASQGSYPATVAYLRQFVEF
jgi:hypothetical protein